MSTPSAAPQELSAETLFRRHAAFVASFLVRLGVVRDDIDDLVQDVFLVAHRKGGFVATGAARPTTWLAMIALRVASEARRRKRRNRLELDEERVDGAASSRDDPFDALARQQALARVQRALDAIVLERRAVFILFELEGESCEAIAAGLGIPVGTVYSRLHHARREFERAYTKRVARPSTAARAEEGGAA